MIIKKDKDCKLSGLGWSNSSSCNLCIIKDEATSYSISSCYFIARFAEGKPSSYKECIKNASDTNSKWIEYKADVNKCRAEFGVACEY